MPVIYLSKDRIHPRFGYADIENQIAYVREDLPAKVKDFVKCHELYHLRDNAKWWIWREIKANAYAGIRHPSGFIQCIIMSMSKDRLIYYYERFKVGK